VNPATSTHNHKPGIDRRFLLPAVLAAALAVRLVFFTGYFGSDEVTYTEQAVRVLQGEWPRSNYIGAIRLGITFPVSILMWIFGNNEFAANLWSLLCSLGEIALVFLLARHFWGDRAAVLASLVLACTPLHAHYAGRLMADAPLAFFVTLTFFAVFWGDKQEKRVWYLVAGVSAGMVWWIKGSVALVFLPVFALYVIREKRLQTKWLLMATGFLTMVLLNGLVFQIMENDFWKHYRMTTSSPAEFVQKHIEKTDPSFYLKYLFFDVKHTLFLGPLALLGALLWVWPRHRENNGLTLTVIWGGGLLAMFSLFVVSLNPLLFITKQVNYMTVFLAPLALLAGYALSQLNYSLSVLTVSILVFLGVLGTALEQLNIQSFVANSKASLAFARAHEGSDVFGMTNAERITYYQRLFAASPEEVPKIHGLDLLAAPPGAPKRRDRPEGTVAYAIFDRQTADWGRHETYTSQKDLPDCWVPVGELQAQTTGLGAHVVHGLANAVALLPGSLAPKLSSRLDSMLKPLPALVYQVPSECSR
jgi:4-amino-4-deoxy-L-arabinose transferase-like glycosyltransferase